MNKPLNPADRAAVDNMHKLFNQELMARTVADLTGTTPASWRERIRRWMDLRTKKVIETTGENA